VLEYTKKKDKIIPWTQVIGRSAGNCIRIHNVKKKNSVQTDGQVDKSEGAYFLL
jgi:hypothetical protein